jgi:hypothetical protein
LAETVEPTCEPYPLSGVLAGLRCADPWRGL